MKAMYVYIVECSDQSYYTGVTNDAERRLLEHNLGYNKNCYTYSRRPVKLVFCERFYSAGQAITFEKQVKGWSRKKKKALIDDRWDLLPELAMNSKKKLALQQDQDDRTGVDKGPSTGSG